MDRKVRLTDTDVVVLDRLFSPDSSKVIYTYQFDIGALGYSRSFHALVETKDTAEVINQYVFPDLKNLSSSDYYPVKWINNQTCVVSVNPKKFVQQNIVIDTEGFVLKDVKFKVQIADISNGHKPIIEHFAISPDNQKLLIAYRYLGVSELEISSIDLKQDLPAIGNVYTTTTYSENPVLYGKWTANNTIAIDINSNSYMADYFKPNQGIQRLTVQANKVPYQSEYPGILGGWYNKELYPKDNTLEFLKQDTVSIQGSITQINGWGDSYYTRLTNFFYCYEYDGKKYESYFRANEEKVNLKEGDKLTLIVNKKQPIIHTIIHENAR